MYINKAMKCVIRDGTTPVPRLQWIAVDNNNPNKSVFVIQGSFELFCAGLTFTFLSKPTKMPVNNNA